MFQRKAHPRRTSPQSPQSPHDSEVESRPKTMFHQKVHVYLIAILSALCLFYSHKIVAMSVTSYSPHKNVLGTSPIFEETELTNDTILEMKMDKGPEAAMEGSPYCRHTYFWGGGKSGSSSLFFNLVRNVESKTADDKTGSGPFFNLAKRGLGKEPCLDSREWKNWVNATHDAFICDSDTTHLLNGCPRHTRKTTINKIISLTQERNITFLMLIRDPVDRLVSHLNDSNRRGGARIDIEGWAQRQAAYALNHKGHAISGGLTMQLSYQGEALKNLLLSVKDPKKVLIIPMESLSIDMKKVVDAIMYHIGGKGEFTSGDVHVNNGKASDNYSYINLSNTTRDQLRKVFQEDVQLLENLVGRKFSWSSWAYTSGAGNETLEGHAYGANEKNDSRNSWLVTSPTPQIDLLSLSA